MKRLTGWLLLTLLVGLTAGCRQARVTVTAETPFFATPEALNQPSDVPPAIVHVATGDMDFAVEATQRVYLGHNPAVAVGVGHPIMVYTNLHRVTLPTGVAAWVSEDLIYNVAQRQLVPRPLMLPLLSYLAVAAVALLLLLIAYVCREGLVREVAGGGIASRRAAGWALAGLLLLRLTLLLLVLFFAGRLMIQPTDENSYFRIAHDLLRGSVDRPWEHTIGLGLLYVPFVLATGADSYFDVVWPLTWANALVLAPAALAMVFFIVQRLSRSTRVAWLVVFVLAIWPFIQVPVEYHAASGATPVFKTLLGTVTCNAGSYALYHLFFWVGWTGLSDVPSMVLVLGAICLCLWMAPGRRFIALLGLVVGLACLVRINNVLFAPLFAYLAWRRMAPDYRSPRQVLGYLALGIGVFAAVFSAQLAVNLVQNGGLLQWPYIYHTSVPGRGFEVSALPLGIDYLIGFNFLPMALAAVGLWFVRDPHRRTVLVLWALPVTLFFCGYVIVTANPSRWLFAAYGAYLAAAVMADDCWGRLPTGRRFGLALVIAANVVIWSPVDRFAAPRQWGWSVDTVQSVGVWLPLLSLALAVVLCAKERRPLIFAALFLAVWYMGSPTVVFISFCALLARALVEAVWLSRQALPVNPSP